MKKLHAYYYDGQSSHREAVEVCFFESGEVSVTGETIALHCRFDTLRIDPRVGNMARHIHLAGGAQLETADNDTVDSLASRFGDNMLGHWIHKLESNWRIALAALLLTVAVIWAGIAYGVPAAAEWAAARLPQASRIAIGERSLHSLDETVMTASQLAMPTRQRLSLRFQRLTASLPGGSAYRLAFRDSAKLGANAFALPSGTVIVTDALVKSADNDEQVIAVLAHELGHLQHDHGLRSLLQNSMTAMIVVFTLGDAGSVSSFAVTLPTLLVEARYSRKFEWEADAFALALLRQQGIPATRLAEMLTKMQGSNHDEGKAGYFSSHPGMAERIARIRGD